VAVRTSRPGLRAAAEPETRPTVESLVSLAFPALVVLGFYFLLVRPQRARLRAVQAFQTDLTVGTRVITTAGIHGTVAGLDDATADLEVAPGVVVTFARAALVRPAEEPDQAPVADQDPAS
jgi:preprotein translocase subunit YajC